MNQDQLTHHNLIIDPTPPFHSIPFQVKSSSLSSGARAAAQTLNVPLEQLEANNQHQHQHTNGTMTNANHHNDSRPQTNGHVSHHHSQQQQQHHHQQQQIQHHHSHSQSIEERHHHSNNMIERNETDSPYNGYPPQYVHRKNSSGNIEPQYQEDYNNHLPPQQGVAKHSLLHFAMQHFRNE